MSSYERIKNDPEAKEKRRAYHTNWQREHKDKVKAYQQFYRAKKKQPEKYGVWISVQDRLPAQDGKYLVYTRLGYIFVSYYYKTNTFGFEYSDVTHWMYIPEPPKEGELT